MILIQQIGKPRQKTQIKAIHPLKPFWLLICGIRYCLAQYRGQIALIDHT